MRSRDIVEGEDSEAKIEEEVRAKGDEGPERELRAGVSLWVFFELLHARGEDVQRG